MSNRAKSLGALLFSVVAAGVSAVTGGPVWPLYLSAMVAIICGWIWFFVIRE